MRLKLLTPPGQAHKELASGVSWNSSTSDLFSCSDDQSVHRWNTRGEAQGKVCVLDTAFADLHCCPAGGRQQQHQQAAGGSDVLAAACTDGTLRLIVSNGRLEKSVEAHRGAVLSVRWSADGSAIATAGEDGQVKVWSRAGMLRSTVAQADKPARAVAWGGSDGGQLLFCSGSFVSVRSLQGAGGGGGGGGGGAGGVGGGAAAATAAAAASVSWRAHDSLVLCADWSAANGLIVTGGEDCRYKVWDAFGRAVYQGAAWEHAISSVAWSPEGGLFAAGSFNCLALCDRQGWSYCQVRPACGSLIGLAWSPDGTALAGCGGGGEVVLAALLDVRVEDGRLAATLEGEHTVRVSDLLLETQERLEFRDPVVKLALGYGHLVVCGASQCQVVSSPNWNTPHIFDLGERPQAVLMSERGFALLSSAGAAQVFTYEGRPVCTIRPPGLRPEGLNRSLVSLSSDTLAVASGSAVRCFDTAQGRLVGELRHTAELKAVSLSQFGTATDRLLALVDDGGSLYIVRVQQQQQQQKPQQPAIKLAANVAGPPVWHDAAPMLAAVVDGRPVVWHHPAAAWVDSSLLEATTGAQGDGSIGAGATLELFCGGSLLLRRADGARVCVGVPPAPALLHELVRQGQWDKAVRLARFTGDATVWGCLAALALAAAELMSAEAALAAIGAVDRLQFVLHLRALAGGGSRGGPSVLVAAELAACRGQVDEAEAMLLQAGLVYRAVKLHVRLHNWLRALQLAQKHQQHVDTVLMHRRRHLEATGRQEHLPCFAELQGEPVDKAAVAERVRADKAREAQLGAAAAAAAAASAGTAKGARR